MLKVKVSEWLSQWVSDKVTYLAVRWWLKNIFGLIWDEGFWKLVKNTKRQKNLNLEEYKSQLNFLYRILSYYLSRKALVGAYMHMMIYVDGSLCWHSWQFKEYLWICNWFQPINQSMNCWPLSSPFWGGVGVIEGQLEGRPRGEWRALKPNIIRIPQ